MKRVLSLICVLGMQLTLAWGQHPASPLARLVAPLPGERPLGQVLLELTQQSGVSLSYSSSRIHTASRCHVPPGPPRPLGVVLQEVAAEQRLSYGLMNGQLVLWPASDSPPRGVTAVGVRSAGEQSATPVPLPAPDRPVFALPGRPGTSVHPQAKAALLAGLPKLPPRQAGRREKKPAAPAVALPVSSEISSFRSGRELVARRPAELPTASFPDARAAGALDMLRPHQISVLPAAGHLQKELPGIVARLPVAVAPIAPYAAHTGFQVSLVPPLSTNGSANSLTTNTFSLNLLVGEAQGLRAVEIGGLANVDRDSVRGVQAAGLVNFAGRHAQGVQLAGLLNLNHGKLQGLQAGTILNFARQVHGVQFGLINIAHQVHGTQIGLVNLADSVDGVPVGLISLTRHGSSLHGEVWASESLPLNIVAKVGAHRYYTLFGAAAEPFGNQVEWAFGVGAGTAGHPHGRIEFNLDLMQWFLAGAGEDGIRRDLLTQLRPTWGWQIERVGHLRLILGPTMNLAVAQRENAATSWAFGQSQWLWINRKREHSITRFWPGVQVGLRL